MGLSPMKTGKSTPKKLFTSILTLPPKTVVLKFFSKYDQGVRKYQTNRFQGSTHRNSNWRQFTKSGLNSPLRSQPRYWESPRPSADIYAVYLQKHNLAAKVRVFVDFLVRNFGESTHEWSLPS
jgi:hypothetical protein